MQAPVFFKTYPAASARTCPPSSAPPNAAPHAQLQVSYLQTIMPGATLSNIPPDPRAVEEAAANKGTYQVGGGACKCCILCIMFVCPCGPGEEWGWEVASRRCARLNAHAAP